MVKLYYNQKNSYLYIEHSCSLKARLLSPWSVQFRYLSPTGTTVQSLSSQAFSVLKGPQSMVSLLSLVLVQVYTSLQSLSIVSAVQHSEQSVSLGLSVSLGPQFMQFWPLNPGTTVQSLSSSVSSVFKGQVPQSKVSLLFL